MTTQREPAFVIDPRARAMLAEMGIRVWLPAEVPQTKHAVVTQHGATAQTNHSADSPPEPLTLAVRREPPLRLPVVDAPPAAALTAALGDVRYVIGNLPTDASSYDLVVLGEPCQGAAASLLANMLRVLTHRVSTSPRIFMAQMVASQNDSANLHEQLTALPAKLILALGPHAAKALLGAGVDDMPFSRQRGIVHTTVHGRTVVTYHPQQLLRQPLAKASSWQDIRRALDLLGKS